MFHRLMQHYHVFEEFSTYVVRLGKKIRDPVETNVTSHMRLHMDKNVLSGYGMNIIQNSGSFFWKQIRQTEICYNIKHFELHGRNLKDPWSCRQAVFYQRHSFVEHSSIWIVIQGPTKLKSMVEQYVSSQGSEFATCYEHPLYLQVQMVNLLERNWTSYLITLEECHQNTVSVDAFFIGVWWSFNGSCASTRAIKSSFLVIVKSLSH